MSCSELKIPDSTLSQRRLKIFGITILNTLLATLKWIKSLPTDISNYTAIASIVLFALTFAWIALFFWSSIFGFLAWLAQKKQTKLTKSNPENITLSTKTAILVPVYNESPQQVFANVLAMAEDLTRQGQINNFDFFILSDTTNPKVWIDEEKTWLDAKRLIAKIVQAHTHSSAAGTIIPHINLFYRKRPKNIARKSGNIEDFCNKWGKNYNFMIVLDADSLITAQTMIYLAKTMENNPQAGIIQATPLAINHNTLFARLQQFASKVYGPVVAFGTAYWQGNSSNYWGHNAIIRVQAFMDSCGLPVLKGRQPFGGYILSHDFVEAALIKRAGWETWLLPDLEGSYEEVPPTLIDFAIRDRRWCQGNLQHLKVLFAKGIHPISRIHFIIGIMSYLSSLLWLSFLIIGLAVALSKIFFPPVYFSTYKTLFPEWPIFDVLGTILLFALSMSMLLVPKFLGVIIYLQQSKMRIWQTLKSVFIEIIISSLFAPIMMMFQSKFIIDILFGRSVAWNIQSRSDMGTSFKTAVKRHIWQTGLGWLTMLVLWYWTTNLFWWMLPINLGLILSIPISILTSKVNVGLWFKKRRYFLTPEEIQKPQILVRSKHFLKELNLNQTELKGIKLLFSNNLLYALHILMLPINSPAPEVNEQLWESVTSKLKNFKLTSKDSQLEIFDDLTPTEELALLYSAETLSNALITSKLKGN